MEDVATSSEYFKSSTRPQWQTKDAITSNQAAQNSAIIKDEEEYDIDHDHLLLPWACCIPIVLEKFQAKQACCDHYSYTS